MFLYFLVSYFSEADQVVVTKCSESKTTITNISDIPRFFCRPCESPIKSVNSITRQKEY